MREEGYPSASGWLIIASAVVGQSLSLRQVAEMGDLRAHEHAAEPFGHAATHALQPMLVTASNAV
ncbi:hypothetical protein [Mycobacterium sp.]|uniref:hypothetical protein n=1 Tax=Mycobacterium sp. TaxID=1785 RepID=UPI0031E1DC49